MLGSCEGWGKASLREGGHQTKLPVTGVCNGQCVSEASGLLARLVISLSRFQLLDVFG
jgi:hypothetical protein